MPRRPSAASVPKADPRAYTIVLLEEIRSQLQVIAEDQVSFRAEFKRDLAQFREEVASRSAALVAAVKQNSEDMRKNSEDILRQRPAPTSGNMTPVN